MAIYVGGPRVASGLSWPGPAGIVTRCPLVLKLKKLPPESKWTGKVSYQDKEVDILEPAQVEQEINKGECVPILTCGPPSGAWTAEMAPPLLDQMHLGTQGGYTQPLGVFFLYLFVQSLLSVLGHPCS